MNRQGKIVNNKVVGGIEWVKTVLPDGTEQQGYTWNPVRGCLHGCRWEMPDGSIAECYAETVAERVAQKNYKHGFEHHYWTPEVLHEPLKIKTPAKIFLDSMSDLMGHWVPEEEIRQVLAICQEAHWHTFQLLTKNAPRLKEFDFPPNVWIGVSAPPSRMFGKKLSSAQQKRMVKRMMEVLQEVNAPIKWMSIEPLSFDIAPLLINSPLKWAVIGAATNGPRVYQPEAEWVQNLLDLFDAQKIPVFFKGNLEWPDWREDFPASVSTKTA
jgi:protein gp37